MNKILRKCIAFGTLTSVAFGVTLQWNDNSSDETGFKIERAIVGESFVQIGVVATNINTFVDTTMVVGKKYAYRVAAYNQYGNSGYSNVVEYDMTNASTPTNANIIISIP